MFITYQVCFIIEVAQCFHVCLFCVLFFFVVVFCLCLFVVVVLFVCLFCFVFCFFFYAGCKCFRLCHHNLCYTCEEIYFRPGVFKFYDLTYDLCLKIPLDNIGP